MNIWGIQSKDLPQYLSRLEWFLRNFEERSHDRLTVEGLTDSILGADKQVWVCGDFQAVCLTSASDGYVTIEACAGWVREDWQDELLSTIEAWAKSLGKTQVFMMARPGWSRWSKGRGYRQVHIETVKEI